MAIIKYYGLESRSLDVVNSLTANLMKHMLSEKSVKGLLTASVEDIAQAEGRAGEPKDELLYDSGEFDVLYKNSWTKTEKKRKFFRKNIPGKFGTELVVKATPLDIIALQDYLGDSGFDVLEARTVNRATFNFASTPANEEHTEILRQYTGGFVKKENNGLEAQLSLCKNVVWDSRTGSTCLGLITGNVEQILKLRQIIKQMSSSYGTPLKTEGVTFSY